MPREIYQNDDLELQITFLPESFILDTASGTKEEGSLKFQTKEIKDESFGPYIFFKYSWETVEFDVRDSDGDLIDEIERQYQRLQMVVSERGGEYINSHFNQWLIGSRILEKRKIRYNIVEINGVFYCEHSSRMVHYSFRVIQDIFYQWKPSIIEIIHSVRFHF